MRIFKTYCRLFRVHHYIKNFLIFLPLFFGQAIFDLPLLFRVALGFASFCFLSSAVYICNDLCDLESDRADPLKQLRPLAAGEISIIKAKIFCGLFALLSMVLNAAVSERQTTAVLILYGIINLLYSLYLKNTPIVDVMLLVSGYFLRVVYGSFLSGIAVSHWMYLTIICFCFYIGLGKRRNELKLTGSTGRKVFFSDGYTYTFLDKNMYLFLCMTLVFYCLWTVDPKTVSRLGGNFLLWTIPLIFAICIRYNLLLEQCQQADPVSILFSDKALLVLIFMTGLVLLFLLYGNL